MWEALGEEEGAGGLTDDFVVLLPLVHHLQQAEAGRQAGRGGGGGQAGIRQPVQKVLTAPPHCTLWSAGCCCCCSGNTAQQQKHTAQHDHSAPA